jgi:hypothetical protein
MVNCTADRGKYTERFVRGRRLENSYVLDFCPPDVASFSELAVP